MKLFKVLIICLIPLVILTACSSDAPENKPGKEISTESISKENKEFLTGFADKFLNYESIDKRNSAIKNYFTKEAQEKNGLNVQTNADFQSTGQIIAVYQEVGAKDSYMLVVKQQTLGKDSNLLIEIQLTTEDKKQKISTFKISYLTEGGLV